MTQQLEGTRSYTSLVLIQYVTRYEEELFFVLELSVYIELFSIFKNQPSMLFFYFLIFIS